MNATSSAARWRAVVTRDQSANSFVYAVRTTRIFCRPSCPARLARRANIEFFDSPAQAEKAGYRSCKRCKPELHVMVDPHVAIVRRACEMISSSSSTSSFSSGRQRPKLHELAAEANLTPSHFHRVFKKVVGVTPGQYARGGVSGGRKERTVTVGCDGPAEGLSTANGPGHDAFAAVDRAADGDNIGESTIDWNEFDAMFAAAGSPELQVSDTNIENLNPLFVKGSLSSGSNYTGQIDYEDVLDSISANGGGSMTELLGGDSFLLPSGACGGLDQSTIPISPFPIQHSKDTWDGEGFSSYQ